MFTELILIKFICNNNDDMNDIHSYQTIQRNYSPESGSLTCFEMPEPIQNNKISFHFYNIKGEGWLREEKKE